MSELSNIEETMLGPLWARAKYSQIFPELLEDEKAVEIIKNIDYDFSQFEEALGEWRSIGLLIRAKSFDNALKNYIKTHPNTTVVNMAAGLDTTFSRVDNGKIKMYNIDLPDVVEYRKKFIEETDRNINLAKSVFDYSWMDEIEFTKETGIFIISGGFIYYFTEEEISQLIKKIASNFLGGEMIFDSVSKFTVKVINKKAEKAESDLRFKFGVDVPTIFSQWSKNIIVKDAFSMGKRTQVGKNWSFKSKIMNRMTMWLKTAQIIHLDFLK